MKFWEAVKAFIESQAKACVSKKGRSKWNADYATA
jgi:hypothetical protein